MKKVCFSEKIEIFENVPSIVSPDILASLLKCSFIPESILLNSDEKAHIITQKKRNLKQNISSAFSYLLFFICVSIFLLFENSLQSKTEFSSSSRTFVSFISGAFQDRKSVV
jgi:hypothetical protein